jgi:hypothetical protein
VFTNPATSRVVLRMSDGRLSCGCCCNKTEDEFKYAKKVEREYLDLKERYDKLQKNYNELLYRMGK